MAMGVLDSLFEEAGIDNLEIRTAGVMTIPGLMPTQECRQILLKDGIDISTHRSCQVTPELIARATLVLGMTSFHVQMALRLTDCAKAKTFLLKEYTGSDPKNGQIQDPMGCTLEVYKKVYREIRAACRRLVKMDLLKGGPPLRMKRATRKSAARNEGKKVTTPPALMEVLAALSKAKPTVSKPKAAAAKTKAPPKPPAKAGASAAGKAKARPKSPGQPKTKSPAKAKAPPKPKPPAKAGSSVTGKAKTPPKPKSKPKPKKPAAPSPAAKSAQASPKTQAGVKKAAAARVRQTSSPAKSGGASKGTRK